MLIIDGMRNQNVDHESSPHPLRPLRVLIEDPVLVDPIDTHGAPFDVTICSGPDHEAERCPLVMNGTCPLGSFDVVVGALDGPWAGSVRAAWAETPIAYLDHTGPAVPPEPSLRLDHHLGGVVGRVFGGGRDAEDDAPLR